MNMTCSIQGEPEMREFYCKTLERQADMEALCLEIKCMKIKICYREMNCKDVMKLVELAQSTSSGRFV
jgi:hypothetical protein